MWSKQMFTFLRAFQHYQIDREIVLIPYEYHIASTSLKVMVNFEVNLFVLCSKNLIATCSWTASLSVLLVTIRQYNTLAMYNLKAISVIIY